MPHAIHRVGTAHPRRCAIFTPHGYGDQNNDGIVTPADFSAWVANFNANNPLADVNQDGSVTPADFSAWVAAFNNACP